jgi:hypothetical protein
MALDALYLLGIPKDMAGSFWPRHVALAQDSVRDGYDYIQHSV